MNNTGVRGRLGWVLLAMIVSIGPLFSAEDTAGNDKAGYVPPPKNLKLVGDHWTPYEAAQPPEGAEVHVVVAGDCLWALADRYYSDPYLWPTIWDANRWVSYSHWIYPGDALVIPSKPNLVAGAQAATPEPAASAAPSEPSEPMVEQAAAAVQPTPPSRRAGPVLVPAAEQVEIACAGQLYEHFDPAPLTISGRETDKKEMQGDGDVVFLSAGRDMNIAPGSEFTVIRPGGVVKHPATNKPAAIFVQRMGRLRVIAVQNNTATAEIMISCDGMGVGDFLIPYKEMPVPMIENTPLARFDSPYTGRLNGTVLVTNDPRTTIAGTGDLVGIDLGSRAGLTAGDRVFFWRPQEGTDTRRVNAQGVVLSTNAGGSTVKILEARSEITVGDAVEIR